MLRKNSESKLFHKQFIVLLASLALCQGVGIAQEYSLREVKAQMDTMFANLDKSKVSTGFLWDTAVNLVEGEEYNGSSLTDSNYVSRSLMADMLYSINTASVGADTIGVQSAMARLIRNSSFSQPMVGILFKPYNYIVANALTDNLIVYSNNRVSDSYINGIWQNPYAEDVLFGYAIGCEEAVSTSAVFTIGNIDSLSTQSFTSIKFDPGDGGGFRTVSMGGSVTANYSASDYYETKLEVTYAGSTYLSHGMVYATSVVPSPHHSQHPAGSGTNNNYGYNDSFSTVYEGKTYYATVSYSLPLNFNNPLIVAEQFDPWKLTVNAWHGCEGFSTIDSFKNDSNLPSKYDVFYIDWHDPDADIRANAELLKEVIRWVNRNKTSGNANVVMGQSMGGLIARYALCDMERHGEAHDTKLFISHDTPHLGANVSPGLQFLYRDLYELTDNKFSSIVAYLTGFSSKYEEVRQLCQYKSVRQMLAHYVNESLLYDNSEFLAFQDTLNAIGFPRGYQGRSIDNVAIANGGNVPSGAASLYSSGDKMVNIDLKASTGLLSELCMIPIFALFDIFDITDIPASWIAGKSTIHYNYSVYPFLSNNSVARSSSGVFHKKYLWLFEGNDIYLHQKVNNNPSAGVPLDNARASYYRHGNGTGSVPLNIVYNSWWNGSFNAVFEHVDSIAFIPVASALAMPNGYDRNCYTNKPEPLVDSPFGAFILPQTHTKHPFFFDGISSWLQKVDTELQGPLVAFPGDVYSISPSTYASSFAFSKEGVTGFNINSSTGTVSGTGKGLATIYAKDEGAGYAITKKKDVLAGLPRMILRDTVTNGVCTVRAEFIDAGVEEFVYSNGLEDSLTFTWSSMVDGSPITGTSINDLTYAFPYGSNDTTFVAELSVSYRGHVQTWSKRRAPYTSNVIEVSVRPNGLVNYFVDISYPYSLGTPQLTLKLDPTSGYTGSAVSRIKVLGKTLFGFYPITDPPGYICFPVFEDSDVQAFIATVTNDNEPLLLDIDLYSGAAIPENYIQTISIPIFYDFK